MSQESAAAAAAVAVAEIVVPRVYMNVGSVGLSRVSHRANLRLQLVCVSSNFRLEFSVLSLLSERNTTELN